MPKLQRLLTCAMVLLASAGHLDAKEQSWANLQRLRAGRSIRVERFNAEPLKGAYIEHSEEAIRLRVRGGDVTVPRSDVRRVSSPTRLRRARNIAILTAAGLGLGLGTAVGLTMAGALGEEAFVTGWAASLTGGGVLGATVDALLSHNVTHYRARK